MRVFGHGHGHDARGSISETGFCHHPGAMKGIRGRFWGTWGVAVLAGVGCTTANPMLDSTGDEGEVDSSATEGMATMGTTASSSTTGSDDGGSTAGDAETGVATTDADSGSDGETGSVCGSTCASAVPPGWNGPAAVLQSDHEAPAPDCPSSFPEFAVEVGAGLVAPEAACDCDCGDPTGLTCAAATVRNYGSSSTCSGTPDTVQLSPSPNSCTAVNGFGGGDYYRFNAGAVTGGNCEIIDNSAEPAEPFFSTRITVCGGAETAGDCEGDTVCVPDAGAASACIWQTGNLQCPEGSMWSERSLYYTGWSDTRGCTACQCGDATGTCPGRVSLLNTGSCGFQDQGAGSFSTGVTCERGEVPGFSVAGLRWSPDPIDADCQPSGGDPQGDAVAQEPVTVCCLAR